MVAEKRFPRIGPFHWRLDRRLRGDAYFGSNIVTFGAVFANTVPFVPSAQWLGTADGFPAYAFQSGIGTAGPTQFRYCTALGSPVLSSAEEISVVFGVFWNMPT